MKYENRIIKTLTDFGELKTGRLCAIVGVNYYKGLNILQKMWEEGKIVAETNNNETTWKLKEEATTEDMTNSGKPLDSDEKEVKK